jgi:hypothetical protein
MSKNIIAIAIFAAIFSFGCSHLARDKNGHLIRDATGHFVTKKELRREQEQKKILFEKRLAQALEKSARIAKSESEEAREREARERTKPPCKYVRISGMACAYGLVNALKPISEMSRNDVERHLSKHPLRNIYNGLFGYHSYGCTILHAEEKLADWAPEWVAFFHVPFRTYFFALRENAYCPGQTQSLSVSR